MESRPPVVCDGVGCVVSRECVVSAPFTSLRATACPLLSRPMPAAKHLLPGERSPRLAACDLREGGALRNSLGRKSLPHG